MGLQKNKLRVLWIRLNVSSGIKKGKFIAWAKAYNGKNSKKIKVQWTKS